MRAMVHVNICLGGMSRQKALPETTSGAAAGSSADTKSRGLAYIIRNEFFRSIIMKIKPVL